MLTIVLTAVLTIAVLTIGCLAGIGAVETIDVISEIIADKIGD